MVWLLTIYLQSFGQTLLSRLIDLMPFANIHQGCEGSFGIKRGPSFLDFLFREINTEL